MAQSVAGKIRVDVVGNVGQFTGSMREAKESLGGFTQEYDRAVRGSIQERAGRHRQD